MRYLYLSLLVILASISAYPQCTLPNPVNTGLDLTPNDGNWATAHYQGGFSGQDYVTFNADTGKCYVITTLSQLMGAASALDFQVSVFDHATGLAAPGFFGSAYNDDHNYGAGYTDPLLLWRPSSNGTYRVVVTKYAGGSCIELDTYDFVKLGISSFPASDKVAFVAAIADTFWSSPNNWTYISSGGSRGVGQPVNLDEYRVYAGATLSQPVLTRVMRVHSDTIKNLLVSTSCTVKVANRLEVLDSVHVYNYGVLGGGGYLAVNQGLDLTNIRISNIHLTNSKNRQSELIGTWGAPPFPHQFDTLIMESPQGVLIENFIMIDHVKFRRGIIEHKPTHSLNDFRRLILTGTHDGASDSSHIKSFESPVFSWGFQDQRFYVGGVTEIPIGTGTRYRPIKIEFIYGGLYEVEVYRYQQPTNASQPALGPGLDHVSLLEGWIIDIIAEQVHSPTNSWAAVYNPVESIITMHWDQYSGVNPSYVQDLRVATEGPSNWLNCGLESYAGRWVESDTFSLEVYSNLRLASASSNNPLPLGFESVDARRLSEGIQLDWMAEATEGEFIVQRSLDGQLFEQLAVLPNGNTRWLDASPREGENFYSVILRNESGQQYPSPVVSAFWKESSSFKLIARRGQQLEFSTGGQSGIIQIVSIDGKIISEKTAPPNQRTVTIPFHAPRGNYIARMGGKIVRFSW